MTTHCVTRVTFGDSAPKGLPPAIEILPRARGFPSMIRRTASYSSARADSILTAISATIPRSIWKRDSG